MTRCESSTDTSAALDCVGLLMPKNRTTSSRVPIALQTFAYELFMLLSSQLILGCWGSVVEVSSVLLGDWGAAAKLLSSIAPGLGCVA